MKRECLIKLLIVSGIVLSFTPNLAANAATVHKANTKEVINGAVKFGWINKGEKIYYIKSNGELARYLQKIDGKTYYFNSDGEMVTGWLKYADTNEWHYFGEDGAMHKGWLKLNKKTYYFDQAGESVKYLQKIDGKTYYFNGDGEMVTGWLKYADTNEWHYFGEDGAMHKGWLKLNKKTYYFDQAGESVKYLQKIDGKTYYFNSDGEMVTGWLKYVDINEWHYFGEDGAMHKGWLKLNKKTYYFDQDGESVKYLQDINGKTYYFNSDGEMVTGWLKYAGKDEWHYFGEDGAMNKEEVSYQSGIEGMIARTSIARKTNQILLVLNNKLTLFEKSRDGMWYEELNVPARCGYNGMTSANSKHEGDGRTPTGAYKILYAFGTGSNPGTKMNYRRITSKSCFVDDVNSKYYNTWVEDSSAKGEHMIKYPTQYKYGMVIGYNTSQARGKGSAIFLHCNGRGNTAGCISIPEYYMLKLMKTLKNPYIIITTSENDITRY